MRPSLRGKPRDLPPGHRARRGEERRASIARPLDYEPVSAGSRAHEVGGRPRHPWCQMPPKRSTCMTCVSQTSSARLGFSVQDTPGRPTIRTSYRISTSPLRRNFDPESVQRALKRDLTGQARVDLTIIWAVEQLTFVLGHGGQPICEGQVDVHVTGSAGAATAAKGELLIEAGAPNDLHKAEAHFGLNRALFSCAAGNDQFRHAYVLIGSSGAPADWVDDERWTDGIETRTEAR